MAKVTSLNAQRSLAKKRRQATLIELVAQGARIKDAIQHPDVGVSIRTYDKWRKDDSEFAINLARVRNQLAEERGGERWWEGDHYSFAKRYFAMEYADFQLEVFWSIDQMKPGDMLLVLFPPGHGKTSMYENLATERLALDPSWRTTIASENITISRRILRRIRDRFEPDSSAVRLRADYGPFKLEKGHDGIKQVWSRDMFDVKDKRQTDERDYSAMAIGRGASIVSTRTDHLQVDDIQSTKTLGQTEALMEWFRQDALSRPHQEGITTIFGTRVGPGDFYRKLIDDPELQESGLLRVIKLPALREKDGKAIPLWPARFTESDYDKMRIKVGPEAWARNWQQQDGDTSGKTTFGKGTLDACKNEQMSLTHDVPRDSYHIIGLDPALGGTNAVIGCETTLEGKLVVRYISEATGLMANEEIMNEVLQAVHFIHPAGTITDLQIEHNNFQRGLANDERLEEIATHYGFTVEGHQTGANKVDPDIGIPSMAGSFRRGDIILPWAADDETRDKIGKLVTQLQNWRPFAKDKEVKMDLVMALWFVWSKWWDRRKRAAIAQKKTSDFTRSGANWRPNRMGLFVPSVRNTWR